MIAATLDGWRAQNAAIRELFAEDGDPAQLAADWRRVRALRARQDRPRPPWIAPAAGVGLFALGAFAGGAATVALPDPPAPVAAEAAGPALPVAARDVWLVYAGETMHPVELGARRAADLTGWLSRRLDAPVHAPDLAAVGLRLVGGRLVPFGAAPAAVLLYEDGTGRRVTVFIARCSAVPGDPGFRFDHGAGVGTVSWHDAGLGYAVSAPLPDARLAELAAAFRRQG
jgi:anti-sigma factor RsiW